MFLSDSLWITKKKKKKKKSSFSQVTTHAVKEEKISSYFDLFFASSAEGSNVKNTLGKLHADEHWK